jgi:hypothetical protein
MSRPVLALALAATAATAALAACAGDRPQRRSAHARFEKSTFDEAWQRSLEALSAQGYELELEDRARGILVTKERELQAPCGSETCLSRERAFLRLTDGGHGIANIQREHWDPAARRWSVSSERAAVAAVEQAQLELARRALGGEPELRRSAVDEPCSADEECLKGLACAPSRRCAKATR